MGLAGGEGEVGGEGGLHGLLPAEAVHQDPGDVPGPGRGHGPGRGGGGGGQGRGGEWLRVADAEFVPQTLPGPAAEAQPLRVRVVFTLRKETKFRF